MLIFDINCGAVTFAVAKTSATPRLPTFALPDTFNVPVILAPVPVTTTTFALPATDISTLLFATGIATLLLPLLILLVLNCAQSKFPLPSVCKK